MGGEDGEACFNGFLHDDYRTYLGGEDDFGEGLFVGDLNDAFRGELEITDTADGLVVKHKHK
jgi:hypothetical protein